MMAIPKKSVTVDVEQFRDAIIEAAASKLVIALETTAKAEIAKQVTVRLDGAITDSLKSAVESIATGKWQPTDSWGNPKGEAVTLATLIQRSLDEKIYYCGLGDRDSRQITRLEAFVADFMKRDIGGAIWKAVFEMKQVILKEVGSAMSAELMENVGKRLGWNK
jgi:hypothetical protein